MSGLLTWDTSCLDWKERILSGKSLVPDLPLFVDEADRAESIFRKLRIPDVPGTPTMDVAAGDWLFPIVRAIFGSLDATDPLNAFRMIQEYFLLIPKKNSKTSSAAAIMIVALLMNRRPNAEFLLIAPTKEIAATSFDQAQGIIKADPSLVKLFNIQPYGKKINFIHPTHNGRGSYLQVKAADTDAITGVKSTGILIDETHVFAKHSRADQVFTELRGPLASRKDGFIIQITTQSKEAPAGVFKAELTRARSVRDGKRKAKLLPILYELPDEVAAENGWKDEHYWHLVNPNLGRSVDIDFLRSELQSAEDKGQGALALFASQHFNIEIGLALKTDSWAGALYWEQNAAPLLTLQELIAQCEVITCGIDGGGLDDLLSVCFLGRVKGRKQWLHWGKNWCHKVVFERRKSEAPKLKDFAEDEDLIVVDDMPLAFAELANLVSFVDKSGKLSQVGLDAMGVGLIVDQLALRGIAGPERIVGVPQGYQIQGAIKSAEVKLASGELTHAGQPIMRWAVENAKVEPIGNAIRITKQAAGTAKIDPLMALFDAVALMSRDPQIATSAWQTDDLSGLMRKIELAAAASR